MRVFTAPHCAHHEPGAGHPESSDRLVAVMAALASDARISIATAPPATLEPLRTRHDSVYLDRLAAMSEAGTGAWDADTPVMAATWHAALDAAGAALGALDASLSGHGNSFAAIRPPGHHALAHRGMGFCYVNHVAVLAAEARRRGGERVLIIDWDVHHGNGTQAMIATEPDTRFVSMHQSPWYPGTGAADERGVGNCFNLPQRANLPPATYLEALWSGITAATTGWRPEVILVSAGYDGMLGDPLGGFTLEPVHYADWTHRLREAFPDTPIAMVMEGGYLPDRLAAGVLATVQALGD